jgi:transcriptional regulator with XRE-family HTH domain
MAKRATDQLLENLNALLAAHGISQAELARRARMSQTTVSGLFRGLENGSSPRLETIEDVARGFGVSVLQLMSPGLKIAEPETASSLRVLSKQLGRLTEDFLSSDDTGRQEILRMAEGQASRSTKTRK